MAAPVNGVLDSFNVTGSQALNAPRLGWGTGRNRAADTTLSTDVVPTFASFAAGTNNALNMWATLYGVDQEAWLTIGPAPDTVTLFVRGSGPNASPQTTGYLATIGWNGFANITLVNGGATILTLGSGTFPNPATGDQFNFSARGSTLELWRKPAAGSWAIIPGGTIVSATHVVAGYIGVGCENGSTGQIDAFGGGALVDSDQEGILSGGTGARYSPPRSRAFFTISTPAAPAGTDFTVMATSDRPVASYSPPRSQVLPIVGDGTATTAPVSSSLASQGRPIAWYSPPRSLTVRPFGNDAPIVLPTAYSRPVPLWASRRPGGITLLAPNDPAAQGIPTTAVRSPRVPMYVARSSIVFNALGLASVVVDYPTGGGGLGFEPGADWLQRYRPQYQGRYRPGYKPTLRKQR